MLCCGEWKHISDLFLVTLCNCNHANIFTFQNWDGRRETVQKKVSVILHFLTSDNDETRWVLKYMYHLKERHPMQEFSSGPFHPRFNPESESPLGFKKKKKKNPACLLLVMLRSGGGCVLCYSSSPPADVLAVREETPSFLQGLDELGGPTVCGTD